MVEACVALRRRSPRKSTSALRVLGFGLVWYLTVLSGLSTSLTAVAFAAIVPIRPRAEDGQSPLKEAMHDLHPWNAFLVLPLFAFAKAGVSFAGLSLEQAFAPLVIAIPVVATASPGFWDEFKDRAAAHLLLAGSLSLVVLSAMAVGTWLRRRRRG